MEALEAKCGCRVKVISGEHAYKKGEIVSSNANSKCASVMLSTGDLVEIDVVDLVLDGDPAIMFAERANDPITW